ncbi:autotransporter domain-containing protein [Aquamicrobium segne]|uniref:Autotransporter domain-containing protein n=1 Tax=Aquamicrobium segne TaxID=469547 RepID=A0ABW0GTI1_9HYPH
MLHIDPVSTLCLTRGDARTLLWSGASALALLVAMAATPVAAQTCAFSSNQDAGANTLRACVEQANAGAADTVVSGLTPDSTVVLQSAVAIGTDLTIGGQGPAATLLRSTEAGEAEGLGEILTLTTANTLTIGDAVSLQATGDRVGAIDIAGAGGVLDFSGRIETTGYWGAGIAFSEGASAAHVRGVITTHGSGSQGVVGESDDFELFLYGAIETTGQSASGISAEGLRNAYHLQQGSTITVSGKGADGINLNVGESQILVDGTIITKGEAEGISAGFGANGIHVSNYGDVGNEIRLKGNGAILTEGEGAVGIYATGGGNSIFLEHGSRIETRKATAAGISANGGNNRIEVTGATITTQGENAVGIIAGSSHVLLGQDSEIITHGQGSAGIRSGGSGGTITLGAGSQIETGGNFAYGIDANLNAVVLEAGSRIETAGQRAYGINFATTQTSPRGNAVIAGAIATSGEYAAGIQASAGRSDITIKSGGSVVTTGASAPGQIIPHAMSLNGGANRVTVENGALVSSAADNAHGIWMGSSTGVGNNYIYVGGTVSATGAGANAIRFTTGNNRLELQPGYNIVGDVVGVGNDVLAFGGEGSASFDLARLGGQYTGFGSMQKVGGSTWALTGNGAGFTGPITITGGTLDVAGTLGGALSVQSGGTLGGSGTLGAVTVANGGILSPGNSPGTLSMASLVLNSASVLDFELGTPGVAMASDRIDVSGSLTLDGLLNVTDAGGFGNGVYTLINYGTLAADNGLTLGATPDGYTYAIDVGTGTASAVTLAVSGGTGGHSQYWDGANAAPGGTLYGRGGAGVWNDANTNWTDMAGAANDVWGDQFGIFYNGTGNVTVDGVQSATGLQFAADGYRLAAGAGGALQLTGTASVLRVDAGHTATLALPVTVAGDLSRLGAGTLVLTGTADITGKLLAARGETRIADGGKVTANSGAAIGVGAGSAGSVLISGTNSELHVLDGGLKLGFGGAGELTVTERGHMEVEGHIDVQVSGTTTKYTPTNGLRIGANGGTATLTVNNGGTVAAGLMIVGDYETSEAATASVVLDGPGSKIVVSENVEMISGGTFTVSGGAQLHSFAASALATNPHRETLASDRIGGQATNRSTMTVTGGGSLWHSDNAIRIDRVGTINVEDDATLYAREGISVGRGRVTGVSGPSAILTVDGATLETDGDLDVANGGGWAKVAFTNGASIETAGVQIGSGWLVSGGATYTALADVLVSGAGTTWTDNFVTGWNFFLGNTGQATLTITDEAVVDTENAVFVGRGSFDEGRADVTVSGGGRFSTDSILTLGETATGIGTLTVIDATSLVEVGRDLRVGLAGKGEVTISNDGVVDVTGNTILGAASGGEGRMTLSDSGQLFTDGLYLGLVDGSASGFLTIGDGSGHVSVGASQLDLHSGALRLGDNGVLILGSGPATIGALGLVTGTGEIQGDVVVGGRMAPGHDRIGTLTITGDVDFAAGSTYAIRIAGTNPDPSPAATVDSLSVGGTADLSGGSVEIVAIDPRTSYVDGHTYATPILTAAGGLGGTEFADVGMTSNSAFIIPTLSYLGDDVFLTIAVTQDFTTVAQTFNQFQTAGALNGFGQTGDALAAFNAIANMNADDARRAFDLTSGEVHAAGQHVIDQTFALFNRTLRYQGVAGIGAGNVGAQTFTAPLGYGPAVAAGNAGVVAIGDATDYADARVRGAWAAPLGGFGHVDSDGNAGKLDWWNAGLAGGYEGVIDVASGKAVGGIGFGYIHSRGTIDDRLSTFDADGFYLGAYGAWADGPWNVAGSLSYGANRVSTERNIAFMGTTAEASYWTHTIGLSGEAAYAFDLADTTKLAPLFTLDAGWSGHGGFTETGAGALNLTSGSQNWSRLDTGLGLALTHTILTENGTVTLEGRAVWEHAFSDVLPSQSLALAGSPTSFTILGPDSGRDRLRIGAGLSWDVSDDMTLRARYDGLFSGNQANHAASLGLNIRF